MKIKFLGAAGGVSGSSYLLVGEKSRLMIDFGSFQGSDEEEGWNYVEPQVDWDALDGVILTHAHLDHCGRLPLLVKHGYTGPVFMTEATEKLVELSLYDSAKIAKEDQTTVLFEEEDVDRLMKLVRVVAYDRPFEVNEFSIKMVDAGHILGSASVVIEDKRRGSKIVFSGDLGNTPEPLLSPTEWVTEAEVAVVESTYGDKFHEPREEYEELAKIVEKAEKQGSVVLIPSFSLQRAQEILFLFDQLKKAGKMNLKTPVFLDSPMAIKATAIFKEFPELYSRKLKEIAKKDDPFDFPGLVVTAEAELSKQIKNVVGVKVIVAGSGMVSGGRIVHHVANYIGEEKTQIVFVGYQAEGTLGRKIKDGEKEVVIYGEKFPVRAEIVSIDSMSAHADQGQLMMWLKKIYGLKRVYLTHGEDLPRLVLMEKIKQEMPGVKVDMPRLNQELEIK